ncbi:phosphatase PAP2 family protein [Aeromicrobium sp. 9AM]|uniref:phosphatase PAP2 family protein n=1 Tax=Aeromicrobium sp. 9AM TaxID=2653126 RepID=UPI0012F2EB7A|nr:phosphatase PAP2 family protein [Aeromicrobium sp. 9AM]VXC37046.1 conserved membrane hypothetical protein [Aeromicrobium sp. 9AM]
MRASVDVEVARWCADHRITVLTKICRVLEDVGESTVFLAALVVVGLLVLVVRRMWLDLPSVGFAFLAMVIVNGNLKHRIDRPRPPADLALTTLHGSAMPSSHAVLTSSILVAILMVPQWTSTSARRTVGLTGAAGCIVTGAAMVYLGGHWLTDVLVGWAVGIVMIGGTLLLWRRIGLPTGKTA